MRLGAGGAHTLYVTELDPETEDAQLFLPHFVLCPAAAGTVRTAPRSSDAAGKLGAQFAAARSLAPRGLFPHLQSTDAPRTPRQVNR